MTEPVLASAETLEVCADCGEPVIWYPRNNRWASRAGQMGTSDVFVFTCRIVREEGRLLEADYHYVLPETQERWRLNSPKGTT